MTNKLCLAGGILFTSLLSLNGCGYQVNVPLPVTATTATPDATNIETTTPIAQISTPASTTSPEVKTTKLAPGTYCYSAKTKTLDANAKINISPTNKVDGTVQAVIQNPAEGYYTSYNQTLKGELVKDQAKLNIVTKIEYDTQNKQETWKITESNLNTGRETFVKVDCAKLTANETSAAVTPPSNKPVRVKFAKGANSTTLKNSVVRGDRNTYILGAKQGQQMNLKITSLENNTVFDAIAPDGKILQQEATTWNGKLPASGDYQVIVGGTRGNASYELTVEIK